MLESKKQELINCIRDELAGVDENVKVVLPQEILEKILLEYNEECDYYKFVEYDFLKKLDLTNFSYHDLYKSEIPKLIKFDIPVDPQEIYEKDLSGELHSKMNFAGANFDGNSFDGCNIRYTNFKGSKGAKINPQTIKSKSFFKSELSDVEFIGSFDDCYISCTKFKGSKGARINPQTVYNKDLSHSNFADVEFIGPFDNCKIVYSSFKKSKGTRINPQTIHAKDLRHSCYTDVEFIGPFDDCKVSYSNFKGSIQTDVKIIGFIDNCEINNSYRNATNFNQSSDNDITKVKKIINHYKSHTK